MFVREYKESDLDALRAIHSAQGFAYALPDLRNPLFVTRLVLCGDPVAQALPVQAGFRPEDSSSAEAPSVLGPRNLIPEGMNCSGGSPSPSRVTSHESAVTGREASSAEHSNASREGHCRILGAALLRLTAEAYLLLDPRAGTPRERWQWLLALHEAARRDAWQRGLEDVHAWLPPPIAKKFGRRLERLGWRRDDAWTPYCTQLVGK